MAEFVQFLMSGLTVGAVYALVALGFTLVYTASDVVNFAQGEFVMLGGMVTVFVMALGVPLPLAALVAVAVAIVVGLLLYWLAIAPARGASAVTLIIITIGASILLRGVAQIVFDKQFHKLPAFSGDTPINLLGAAVQPQSFWVIGGTALIVLLLYVFLEHTLLGKALRATAANRLAARLVGINTATVMALAFGGSAAITRTCTPSLRRIVLLTRYTCFTAFRSALGITHSQMRPSTLRSSSSGAACATKLPFEISAMSVAVASTSETMCVDRITMRWPESSDSKLRNRTRSSGSRPAVGSSTISSCGSLSRACAIPTRCFMPPEKPPSGRPRTSDRFTTFSS